jgi:hypothetical protein
LRANAGICHGQAPPRPMNAKNPVHFQAMVVQQTPPPLATLTMSTAIVRTPSAIKPPANLVSFVRRRLRDAHLQRDVDRREEERHPILVSVFAQPVDEQYRAIGEPFALVTRDISEKGIGLVHTEPITDNLLALHMSLAGEEVNVVVRLCWSKALGPFYYLGGEFVAKLTSLPQPEKDAPAGHPLGVRRIDNRMARSTDVSPVHGTRPSEPPHQSCGDSRQRR